MKPVTVHRILREQNLVIWVLQRVHAAPVTTVVLRRERCRVTYPRRHRATVVIKLQLGFLQITSITAVLRLQRIAPVAITTARQPERIRFISRQRSTVRVVTQLRDGNHHAGITPSLRWPTSVRHVTVATIPPQMGPVPTILLTNPCLVLPSATVTLVTSRGSPAGTRGYSTKTFL